MHSRQILLVLFLSAAAAAPAAAQEIARVGQDIHVAAGETATEVSCVRCSVRIDGRVTRDVGAVMGSVSLGPGAEVGGDVGAVLGSVFLDENARVGGDLGAVFGNVSLGHDSEVRGDVGAVLGRVDREPSARVGGEVAAIGPAMAGAGLGMALLLAGLLSVIPYFVVALICFALAGERRVGAIAATVRERPGMVILTGLGTCVAVVAGYWVASLLGPVAWILALVISLLVAGALIAGYTGLSAWLGGAVARRAGPLARVFLGALLIIVIQTVTLFLAMPVFMLLGFGAAVQSGFGSSTDWLTRQFGGAPAAGL
jgi:hypothetical protein